MRSFTTFASRLVHCWRRVTNADHLLIECFEYQFISKLKGTRSIARRKIKSWKKRHSATTSMQQSQDNNCSLLFAQVCTSDTSYVNRFCNGLDPVRRPFVRNLSSENKLHSSRIVLFARSMPLHNYWHSIHELIMLWFQSCKSITILHHF